MTAPTSVLVVEDDTSIADVLRTCLGREGISVEIVSSAHDVLPRLTNRPFAAVLMDVGLDDMDGFEVFRRMRDAGHALPVLFVTARQEEVDRVLGLELGADDYITKPFSPREVVARLRAVLRRGRSAEAKGSLQISRIEVDLGRRTVTGPGGVIDLTMLEFDLLAHLVARPGMVCRREDLLKEVWGYPGDTATRTVDVHIGQLRAKLGAELTLRTVRGVGYAVDS
ncbi:MAG: response regulator [Nocardioides sp.]